MKWLLRCLPVVALLFLFVGYLLVREAVVALLPTDAPTPAAAEARTCPDVSKLEDLAGELVALRRLVGDLQRSLPADVAKAVADGQAWKPRVKAVRTRPVRQ
jgi:hypothetical protein